MAKIFALNKRPLTWPVRIAIGLAMSAPVGYFLLRGRAEEYPLLNPHEFEFLATAGFTLYFTWALARRHWRHPRPAPPGARSRRKLIAGTFLKYLIPCFLAGLLVAWLHYPTLEAINRALSVGNDHALWGFVVQPNPVRVSSPYLGPDKDLVLTSARFRSPAPQAGMLVKLTFRRGALGALYVHEFSYEKVQ